MTLTTRLFTAAAALLLTAGLFHQAIVIPQAGPSPIATAQLA